MAAGPYKRRRSTGVLRNFWIYRWLITAALLLGTLLWFMFSNSQTVTVYLPFGLGSPSAPIGLVVLFSALIGALVAVLLTVLVLTLGGRRFASSEPAAPPMQELPEDRPPSDYAARTEEGFSNAPWTAR